MTRRTAPETTIGLNALGSRRAPNNARVGLPRVAAFQVKGQKEEVGWATAPCASLNVTGGSLVSERALRTSLCPFPLRRQ